MFALCDVNAFYASCETVFRPDLKGRPVVVLSNNDGCVIARSAEAKPLVNMGEPYFKHKALFRRHGITCFSSNYELYADMSSRVMTTIEEIVPRSEVYSIDEVFCDLSGLDRYCDLADFGRQIRARVLQHTHLTVGVGIAPTKTLAKLANYAAKKWQKQTGGVVDLSDAGRQRKLMAALPVSEVWGVGRRIAARLKALGIQTALQLAESDPRFIRQHFNVVLERVVRELCGESCLALDELDPVKQVILCSRSFGERITDYDSMRQAICSYAARASTKLRREQQCCRFISAFIKTSPFDSRAGYYAERASIALPIPTQDSRDITKAAVGCLDKIWKAGFFYQKAGVMLGDFYDPDVAQLSLFDAPSGSPKSHALMAMLDTLNATSGKGTLYFAGQGSQPAWQMRREMLSPRYTTRYADLLRVR